MFFFEAIPWYNAVMWLVVLGVLIGLNEITRLSKWASIAVFILVPLLLTPFWMKGDHEIKTWFVWAKVYSALAGCLIYMVIRFTDYYKKNKWYVVLVPLILAINILEAVFRELQVGIAGFDGVIDGVRYISGGWNYINAIAGLLCILTICGWTGIYGKKEGKYKDMIWADQTNLYIFAYFFWNVSYVYSCVPNSAFYSGVALNLAPIIPAMFWAKGTWMQNRAHTLAMFCLWIMTFPAFFSVGSTYNVALSYNPAANWTLALISLALNGLLAYRQFAKIIKEKLNPLKDEIWVSTSGKTL